MRVQKWGNSAAMRLNAELLKRPVYRLADLLAEMPSDGLPRVAGWDEMPALGKECE